MYDIGCEVKNSHELCSARNVAKRAAATKWCKEHRMTYKVVTEKDLTSTSFNLPDVTKEKVEASNE